LATSRGRFRIISGIRPCSGSTPPQSCFGRVAVRMQRLCTSVRWMCVELGSSLPDWMRLCDAFGRGATGMRAGRAIFFGRSAVRPGSNSTEARRSAACSGASSVGWYRPERCRCPFGGVGIERGSERQPQEGSGRSDAVRLLMMKVLRGVPASRGSVSCLEPACWNEGRNGQTRRTLAGTGCNTPESVERSKPSRWCETTRTERAAWLAPGCRKSSLRARLGVDARRKCRRRGTNE